MPVNTKSTLESSISPSNEEPISSSRSTSLAAAATINAGIQNHTNGQESLSRHASNGSSRAARIPHSPILSTRTSAMPPPGDLDRPPSTTSTTLRGSTGSPVSRTPSMADPHHHRGRQPSVGELYQEFEQEQEAQVNRLLQTIRIQQEQIQTLQAQVQALSGSDPPDSTTSERASHLPNSSRTHSPTPPGPASNRSRRPSQVSPIPIRRLPMGVGSTQSISTEQEGAPILTPRTTTPSGSGTANRDETNYYQAEAEALGRENQILRIRIRELERQLGETRSVSSLNPGASASTNEASQTANMQSNP